VSQQLAHSIGRSYSLCLISPSEEDPAYVVRFYSEACAFGPCVHRMALTTHSMNKAIKRMAHKLSEGACFGDWFYV